MNFKEQIFIKPQKLIKEDAQIIFVADLFVDDYSGGAELTSEALIQASPFNIQKLKSSDVTLAALDQGKNKFWIFGNFAQLNPELIPSIVANLKYAVLEYDYKYCKYRSPEKHAHAESKKCDCEEQINGKVISAFYYGATSLWWMSESQKQKYFDVFPFLQEKDNVVLSSVFSKETLGLISWLKNQVDTTSSPMRSGWIVLGSQSWVKGFDAAKQWCIDNNKSYEVVWNVPYEQVLDKLAHAEGFVYLPAGADTCPRMVIEAKLLGCKLHLNDNVQHATEDWFSTDNLEDIHDYLYTAPELFWKGIRTIMEYKPKISGYTTTYNCVSQGYPFEASIRSMLQFCDEVCVVDGGSTDETWDKLCMWALKEPKLVLHQIKRDWNHPRFAVFDGLQKAEARKMCTGDFCWQMDSDEIVHEDDASKIADLCTKIPENIDIVSLPVIEYWGGPDKVRCDIQPWKWRLSRNKDHITHGIPKDLRKIDVNGDAYASEGTDGCDMIHKETGERLHHITFHTAETERARQAAVQGNIEAVKAYENWFNSVIKALPGVHHYSWYDVPRKIKTYKHYWTKHWNSLYDKSIEDTSDNNMFFDLPWSQVTDAMIEMRAKEIVDGTGGWIWHRKWNGQRVPHISCSRSEPSLMVKR